MGAVQESIEDGIGQPKAARQECRLAGRQVVDPGCGRLAQHPPVDDQFALDRLDRRMHPHM
jgi:hypothetical protein